MCFRKKFRRALPALLLCGTLLAGCGTGSDNLHFSDLGRMFRNFFDMGSSLSSSSGTASAQGADASGGSGSGSSESGSGDASGEGVSSGSDASIISDISSFLDGMSEDYQDNVPDGSSLFVNNAPVFYYYTQLSQEEQSIYDALLAVTRDPTSTKYHKKAAVHADPSSDTFSKEVTTAYEAMIYDHPELFWFRQSSGNFKYYYNSLTTDGTYDVMFQLSKTYDDYQTQMTAFNQAVSSFMADIDLTQSQPVIALQIHDKLIDMVTYDTDLAAAYTPEGGFDFGYTAYGALVSNSRGQANTCVCDGYSYAYEYLLQQAGITCTRVGGYAGQDENSMEAHSWNLVQLDGEWYEVDPTWDDQDSDPDQYAAQGPIISAALGDAAYWNKIRHFMFNLTTDQISHYTPGQEYTYYTEDGYATFLSSSVHVRDDGTETSGGAVDYVTKLAPIANGTTYTYSNLAAYATGYNGQTDYDGDGIPG
ncbi:MAG: transglutaminase domain-containing protein [Bilifractor sp.]